MGTVDCKTIHTKSANIETLVLPEIGEDRIKSSEGEGCPDGVIGQHVPDGALAALQEEE